MERKNLYIDFDGVVLDTIDVLYKEMEELKNGGIKLDTEDERREFFKNYDWHSLLNDNLIINDSINCIQKLIETDSFNINILTHVISIDEAVAKVKYIRKHLKDITIIPVPKQISKTKMVHTKDSILVDDYAGNLREWEKEGGISVRFSKKRNGKGFLVINKLDELIDMFINN